MTEKDPESIIEGSGSHDYLVRSIAIVTLLYERGILVELLESGRLTAEEIDIRTEMIKERFPAFAMGAAPEDGEEPYDEQIDAEEYE